MPLAFVFYCKKCDKGQLFPLLHMYEDFLKNYTTTHNNHLEDVHIYVKNIEKCDDVRPVFAKVFNTLGNKKRLTGAEIGVLNGKNSILFLENLNIKKLYLIDPYKYYKGHDDPKYKTKGYDEIANNIYNNTRKSLKKYNKKIRFFRDLSENVANKIPNNSLDFVYIDGNHSYEYVKRDIELYWPKVKKGGIIGGDDLGLHQPGVLKAVSEFILDNNLNSEERRCESLFEDWWIIK
jgi:hypothetical protein